MSRRGDIVLANFPWIGGGASKNRPAVVVQSDQLNNKLANTIVAMITGNTSLIGKDPAQFLIDPATPEGPSSRRAHASAVKCENLMTIGQRQIIRTLGHLSDELKTRLSDCLKAALEID